MTNTPHTHNTPDDITDRYPIPKAYIFGEVQGQEDHFSVNELTQLQSGLLGSILVSGNIQTFQVLETERLQEIKQQRDYILGRNTNSIGLKNIAPESSGDRSRIVSTLENIGSASSVYERFAWSRSRYQRNTTGSQSLLQTQACCV